MKAILALMAGIAIATAISLNKDQFLAEQKTIEKPKSPDECHKKYNTNTINNEIVKCINTIGK